MTEARAPAALLLAAALALAAAPAEAGPRSALPWPSGAKDGEPCLAQLRGQPLDVQHWHVAPTDFPTMVAHAQGWVTRSVRSAPAPLALLSFALLPAANKGQFAECARGDFDPSWRLIGAVLAAIDTGHTIIVEPGWEANLGSGTHPWGVDDIAQVPDYKACFQRASAALRLTFPMVKIAWSSSKMYRRNFTPDDMMPDPASFDYFGLLYYNTYRNPRPQPPQPITQATWDKYVNSTDSTGHSPSGIGSWLAYATAHGKPMGISEWGVWWHNRLTAAQADDPVYIHNMAQFLWNNASSIAWESAQDNGIPGTDDHRLCPTTNFPNAAVQYGIDFGRKVAPPSAPPPTAPTP